MSENNFSTDFLCFRSRECLIISLSTYFYVFQFVKLSIMLIHILRRVTFIFPAAESAVRFSPSPCIFFLLYFCLSSGRLGLCGCGGFAGVVAGCG